MRLFSHEFEFICISSDYNLMTYTAKISAIYLDRGSKNIITINQAKHEQTKYIPANV